MKINLVQVVKAIFTSFYRIVKLKNNSIVKLEEEDKTLEEIIVEEELEEMEEVPFNPIAVEKFKEIQSGDIIWAKRFSKDNPNEIIKKGHDVGPYLVIENMGDKLLCCYGTSNCESNGYRFVINHENYCLEKKTCFYIANLYEIGLETYIRKLDVLNDYDKHMYQKIINILSRKNPPLKKYVNHIGLEPGDIFKFCKERYFVYQLEDNKITAIRVSLVDASNFPLISDNHKYYIHFDDVIKTNNHKKVVAVDFVSTDRYQRVLVQFQKYLDEQTRKKILQRGSVIKCADIYRYIYSQESDFYLGYRIYGFSSGDRFPIIIEHKKYSANFDDICSIRNSDEFELITTVSEEEANYNKAIKKSYNKLKSKSVAKQKEEERKMKRIQKKNIQPGAVVSDKTLLQAEYLVLERNVHELFTITFDDENISFVYLDISEVNFQRELEPEQFQRILIGLKEKLPNYDKHIDEKRLCLIMDKYNQR